MTALLKKDCYLVGKQAWTMIGIALVFSLTPQFSSFGSVYMLMLTMTLPLTTLAYDERCHWDQYMAMTPCSPKKIVLSKYLFTFLLVLGMLALTFIIDAVKTFILKSSYNLMDDLLTRAVILVMVLTVNSVSLPAVYRFGVEKGRFSMMAMCLMFFGIIMGGAALVGAETMFGWIDDISPVLLCSGLAVILVVFNVSSFFLSIRFYIKRRSGEYD